MSENYSKAQVLSFSVVPGVEEGGLGPLAAINNVINLGHEHLKERCSIWVDNKALSGVLDRLDAQN